ncbi:phage major capsid protein [Eubacteriales bacterium OttesenSCG-928-A19]|nr:phage major capsid protein [Eubacteriales bacterium OttesenSCG-928-A19]
MPMIDRTGAGALIPEPVVRDIISGVRKQSVAMQLMRKLPNMTSGTQRQPVLSMLPQADFVNGDAGMKITTNMAWDKKIMVAGEIAAIVPVPQAVIDDAQYDLWGEVKPALVERIGRVFDRQVFSERNPKAPTEWPDPLVPAAIAAGNVVTVGTGMDIAEDVSALLSVLEDSGYDVTRIAAQRALRGRLRNLRDTNGNPIYQPIAGDQPSTIYSVPTEFVAPGTWDAALALALAGEWDNAVYSIRQDMTFQIFDTGVISDEDGKVVYNLLQQDMVALRAVIRLAWQVANPIDIDRDYGTGFPFAVLQPAPVTP